MKKRNKWSRTGTEMGSSMSQTLERLGGGIGGARRSTSKAKTSTSNVTKADSTASGLKEKKRKAGGRTGIVRKKSKPRNTFPGSSVTRKNSK